MDNVFLKKAEALITDVPYLTANLANLSAFVWEELDRINWAGFYLMQDGALVLGPFQGRPACIRIEVGKGVCGTAVQRDVVQNVPNVHHFLGHIACDEASRSELVVPIHAGNRIVGVLDIDSPEFDRFDPDTQQKMEALVGIMEQKMQVQFLRFVDGKDLYGV